MVHFTETGIMINGKDLDVDQAINFREACVVLKDNFARKVINEQVKYKAIEIGIHKSQSIDELMFSKAAIWTLNEIEILIAKLSQ